MVQKKCEPSLSDIAEAGILEWKCLVKNITLISFWYSAPCQLVGNGYIKAFEFLEHISERFKKKEKIKTKKERNKERKNKGKSKKEMRQSYRQTERKKKVTKGKKTESLLHWNKTTNNPCHD